VGSAWDGGRVGREGGIERERLEALARSFLHVRVHNGGGHVTMHTHFVCKLLLIELVHFLALHALHVTSSVFVTVKMYVARSFRPQTRMLQLNIYCSYERPFFYNAFLGAGTNEISVLGKRCSMGSLPPPFYTLTLALHSLTKQNNRLCER